jgi:hypothetical protein
MKTIRNIFFALALCTLSAQATTPIKDLVLQGDMDAGNNTITNLSAGFWSANQPGIISAISGGNGTLDLSGYTVIGVTASASWDSMGGTQSSVNVSGFNNDAGYLTDVSGASVNYANTAGALSSGNSWFDTSQGSVGLSGFSNDLDLSDASVGYAGSAGGGWPTNLSGFTNDLSLSGMDGSQLTGIPAYTSRYWNGLTNQGLGMHDDGVPYLFFASNDESSFVNVYYSIADGLFIVGKPGANWLDINYSTGAVYINHDTDDSSGAMLQVNGNVNASGFTVAGAIPWAVSSDIPTNVSAFSNDAGYVTGTPWMDAGFLTSISGLGADTIVSDSGDISSSTLFDGTQGRVWGAQNLQVIDNTFAASSSLFDGTGGYVAQAVAVDSISGMDGSGLTGLPNPFDQSLNSTDSPTFGAVTVTSTTLAETFYNTTDHAFQMFFSNDNLFIWGTPGIGNWLVIDGGTGAVRVNATTDNGSGAKLQVNGTVSANGLVLPAGGTITVDGTTYYPHDTGGTLSFTTTP